MSGKTESLFNLPNWFVCEFEYIFFIYPQQTCKTSSANVEVLTPVQAWLFWCSTTEGM